MSSPTPELESLRSEWTTLYSKTLPQLARAKDSSQPRWPVTLDHCFARIILDNTVGNGQQQWDTILPKPAVRNMDEQQLRESIALGKRIESGEADLCHLDAVSLKCRGKTKKRSNKNSDQDSEGVKKQKTSDKRQTTLQFGSAPNANSSPLPTPPQARDEDFEQTLHRIRSHQSLTPYRKRLYTALLSVPRGRYTTYAAMSDYLDSSARAVGSGMRNNPFAPDVPCHRVLAKGGSLGGFCGDWGKDGKHAAKKVALLRSEGVRFDGTGKVIGEPFRKFHLFQGS